MKQESQVCHWRGEKLPFLNKNGCVEYNVANDDFLRIIRTMADSFDVMIKMESGRLIIYLDDKGKGFKQR